MPSRELAFVLLALHVIRRPCSCSQLEKMYGNGKNRLHNALEKLLKNGSVQKYVGAETLWEAEPLSDATVERLVKVVHFPIDEHDLSHLVGYLASRCSLDDCEFAIKHILDTLDKSHTDWSASMNLYVGLIIDFLDAWSAQHAREAGTDNWKFINLVLVVQCFSVYSQTNLRQALVLGKQTIAVASAGGNERFKPFLEALHLYLTSLSRYPTKEELEALAAHVQEAAHLNDPSLDKLMPWLWGMLHFLRGEHSEVVAFQYRIRTQPHWWYKRIFRILSLNTLYSANYLGLYHLAAGISESARQTAFIGKESILSLSYRLQQCFLQLRIHEQEKVRESLEYVMQSPVYAESYVLKSLCARVCALYYYMEGNVHAASSSLSTEVRQAIELGMDVSPFHDPLILDMLYIFEREGYPPIPRYTLDSIVNTLQHAANTHLRGAALRIQALRERDRGMDSKCVAALLRESLQQLVPSGDPRELALTAHELANALERTGRIDEAQRIRKELSKATNHPMDATIDYRQASILCLKVSTAFVAYAACDCDASVSLQSLPLHTGRDILERCHKAFHTFPLHDTLSDMYLSLVQVAQVELDVEQVALFTRDDDGKICCKATVNMTPMELESEEMQPWLHWLQKVLDEESGTSIIHHMFGICLSLDVNGTVPWLISLRNNMTESLLKMVSIDELKLLANIFAAELRSGLRMNTVRDTAINSQYVRLKNIVSIQKEGAMPPLLGEGMKALMRKTLQVSTTDAPILLWGETGVGKEVMARQIHELSECTGPFIAIHPASMPETLFESECFGYERGAFTGANKQKIGLFELADQGTLFIDEIGEISPLIQTKLLRVLQEKRFMRVGGTHEIASHFRLVVATNRDIWKEVLEGRFRQDLLYRISVVPLKIPALRERRQDIIPMATAFINYFSRHYGKSMLPLRAKQQEQLCAYAWPGNIRELRNVIERAVILSDPGEPLHFELVSSQPALPEQQMKGEIEREKAHCLEKLFEPLPTLPMLEEQYLRHVLQLTNGHVLGSSGAAALLHIKHTTLYGKLRKYGIRSSGKGEG